MSTVTVFSDPTDGRMTSQSDAGNYAAALAGTGNILTATTANVQAGVGQSLIAGSYAVRTAAMMFDLFAAGMTAGNLVTAATVSMYLLGGTTINFVFEMRAFNWGPTLTTADWVPGGATLGSKTLLASATTLGSTINVYMPLTNSGTALVDALNAALASDGKLYVIVNSANSVSATAPTGTEQITVTMNEQAGTTQDPKIDITYTVATQPIFRLMNGLERILSSHWVTLTNFTGTSRTLLAQGTPLVSGPLNSTSGAVFANLGGSTGGVALNGGTSGKVVG